MEFHLTRKTSEREGQWLLPIPDGTTVCYEEPLQAHILPQTMSAIQETNWAYQFHGLHYRLRTKSKLIEEFVPASEHHKISWMAMSQKYHGAMLAKRSLNKQYRRGASSELPNNDDRSFLFESAKNCVFG